MLKMSQDSKQFMEKWLPDSLGKDNRKDVLLDLYDLIDLKGFDENEEYNDFGKEAQCVYDDLYANND